MKFFKFGLLVLGILVFSLASVSADNWTQFGYDLNNTGHPDEIPYVDEGIVEKASSHNVSTSISSTQYHPVIKGDSLYFLSPDPDLIYRINASNVSQPPFETFNASSVDGGVSTQLAVFGGFAYAVGSDGDWAALHKFNASNISQNVDSNTFEGSQTSVTAPVVDNEFIYFSSYKPLDNGTLRQFDKNLNPISSFSPDSQIRSSPAVTDKYAYVGSIGNLNGKLYQLNASDISQQISSFDTGDTIYDSPAVANGYVYVSSGNGSFHQLNASDVSQEITTNHLENVNVVSSHPSIANGYVYTAAGSTLYQLDSSNISNEVSSFDTGNGIGGHVAVTDKYSYVQSGGTLYQLNASNISQKVSNISTTNDPSPILANDYLYLSASNISQVGGLCSPPFEGDWVVDGIDCLINDSQSVGQSNDLIMKNNANVTVESSGILEAGRIILQDSAGFLKMIGGKLKIL